MNSGVSARDSVRCDTSRLVSKKTLMQAMLLKVCNFYAKTYVMPCPKNIKRESGTQRLGDHPNVTSSHCFEKDFSTHTGHGFRLGHSRVPQSISRARDKTTDLRLQPPPLALPGPFWSDRAASKAAWESNRIHQCLQREVYEPLVR